MTSIRNKLSDKTTKLARPREEIQDHPAALDNYQEGGFYIIPIGEIRPNPDQPRKYFDQQTLDELSQSIQDKGMLQPIIISRDDGGIISLVAGERRFRAAKQAGMEQIPAILTKGNPAEIALIENLQRENLKPIEESEALARMVDEYTYTQEQLAQVIGKGRTTITEALSLNRLPEEIKEECRHADIYSRRLLVEIAKQKTTKAMTALFNKVKQANLKSNQLREITRNRTYRTPTAMAIDRTLHLSHNLSKLNLTTADETEKIHLISELQNLNKLINTIINQ